MTELLAVVSKVRQRVVDLADQQKLTVIQTSHRFFHTGDSTAFAMIWRPSKSLSRKSYFVCLCRKKYNPPYENCLRCRWAHQNAQSGGPSPPGATSRAHHWPGGVSLYAESCAR